MVFVFGEPSEVGVPGARGHERRARPTAWAREACPAYSRRTQPARVGFDACIGQIVLARRHQEGVGGAVERAQAEVVVQMTAVVDGTASFTVAERYAAEHLRRP
jgi:hypothetical protein